MIISCTNCNKKFEIDSDLIPDNGRLLECSFCKTQWFFKKNDLKKPTTDQQIRENNALLDKTEEPSILDSHDNLKKNITIDNSNDLIKKDIDNVKKKIIIENKNTSIKFLNIIIVLIISFIALIILIDTFKNPIGTIVPNIEIILYNLYESIKDITLFFKDLI